MLRKYINWLKKHKIITAIVAVILLIAIFSSDSSTNKQSQTQQPAETTQTKNETKAAEQPQVPKPKYESIGLSTSERFDKAETIYVVVDPIDTSNDSLKQTMKNIVSDIAKTKNFKEFTVYIYDNKAIATREYNKELPNGAADARAKSDERGQHLVAMYSGGIDLETAKKSTADNAYSISFYPGAFKDTPTVGKYVGTEQFKP